MTYLIPAALIVILALWIALPALIWPAAREARLAAVPLASALTGVLVVVLAATLIGLDVGAPTLANGPRDPLPMQDLWQALLVAGLAQIALAGFGLIATGAGLRRLAVTGASAAHLGIGVLITARLLPAVLPPARHVDVPALGQWLEPLSQGGLLLLGAGLLAMLLALVFRLVAVLTGG